METVIIIPARFDSSRFPGKPLAKILGKPLIYWVIDICLQVLPRDKVFVATDDQRIKNVVEKKGIKAIMTSKNHLTGTDRIAEVSDIINADIYINVQGDEPLINPNDIKKVIDAKIKFPSFVIKGYTKISKNEDPNNVNIPKILFTKDKKLIYSSRNILPGSKSVTNKPKDIFKAVCIYAFDKNNLKSFKNFGGKSMAEKYEDIEILRFLDLDISVKMVETSTGSLAVDIPEDIKLVEEYLNDSYK